MGRKYNNGLPLATGFDLQANRPLDERQIVSFKADLLSLPNCYAGIEIQVEEENYAKYRWNGLDQSNDDNWIAVDEFGGSGVPGEGDMKKSTYDTDGNGVVDDSERLGGELPAYYMPASTPVGDMDKSVYDTNDNGTVDNAEQLGGLNPGEYDQRAHVADNSIHLAQNERDAIDGTPNPPTALNSFATQADIAAAGGGDMLKSVYDKNGDDIVDDSERLGGELPSVYDQRTHVADTNNPHSVNKAQVGLGNVDNTSDAAKPVSTATQTALDNKVSSVVAGANIAVDNTDPQNPVVSTTSDVDLYDGVDTAANILALDPSLYLGQTWFASDTKYTYKAITSVTQGADAWQGIWNIYDEATDTFTLSTTQDGQTQNIGQETFIPAYNTGTVIGTELNPKIYKAIGAWNGAGNFKEIVEASSSDIGSNSVFGINTTPANLNDYTKLLTWGNINGVDTSAWAVNTVLYVGTVAGELTAVRPTTNIYPVAIVTKQHLTEGQIFVNTNSVIRDDTAVAPVELDRIHFTGDTTVATFYDALRGTEGTAPEVILTKSVADDQTLPLDNDWLTIPQTVPGTIGIQGYTGQIEFQINITGGQEKLYVEIYLADNAGAAIDSGSGLPNGTLAQPPITILESALLNTNAGLTNFAEVTGYVETPVDIAVGQRIRYRILVQKVGTAGGNKDFSIYAGSDHLTYINAPKLIEAKDVRYNNTDSSLSAENVKTALDELDAEKANVTDLALKADQTALDAHTGDVANPHSVTKTQVGLGNVDNTSDLDKPISTATQSALDLKADATALDNVAYTNQANQFTTQQRVDGELNLGTPGTVNGQLTVYNSTNSNESTIKNITGQTTLQSQNGYQFRGNAGQPLLDILTEVSTGLDPSTDNGIGNRAYNDARYAQGSIPTDYVSNDTTGEPTGSDSVLKMVSLTQAEYDAGTPVATTFYIITDA